MIEVTVSDLVSEDLLTVSLWETYTDQMNDYQVKPVGAMLLCYEAKLDLFNDKLRLSISNVSQQHKARFEIQNSNDPSLLPHLERVSILREKMPVANLQVNAIRSLLHCISSKMKTPSYPEETLNVILNLLQDVSQYL